jgi:hypothetical protein
MREIQNTGHQSNLLTFKISQVYKYLFTYVSNRHRGSMILVLEARTNHFHIPTYVGIEELINLEWVNIP